jgi:predicted esterase
MPGSGPSTFVHRYVPSGPGPGAADTLVLLHGTGGNEEDLLPLGPLLRPGAALLSPRGNVLENGMPRFFRRLAEGVFDLEDLRFRAGELSEFIRGRVRAEGRDARRVYAVGYSNGANIAAALLLLHPGVLTGAALLHAMVPLEPDSPPNLSGIRVFLSAGQRDPIVPVENSGRLRDLLGGFGAEVSFYSTPGGHELRQAEVDAARDWFAALPA